MDTLIKNYEDLANAIILQAVVDYKRALKSKIAVKALYSPYKRL